MSSFSGQSYSTSWWVPSTSGCWPLWRLPWSTAWPWCRSGPLPTTLNRQPRIRGDKPVRASCWVRKTFGQPERTCRWCPSIKDSSRTKTSTDRTAALSTTTTRMKCKRRSSSCDACCDASCDAICDAICDANCDAICNCYDAFCDASWDCESSCDAGSDYDTRCDCDCDVK